MTTLPINMRDQETQQPKCGNCGSSDIPTVVLALGEGDCEDVAEVCSSCLKDWLKQVEKVEAKGKAELDETDIYEPPYCPDPHAAERSRMAEESRTHGEQLDTH